MAPKRQTAGACYKHFYHTPANFDDIWLMSDGKSLTGLWFVGSRDELQHDQAATEQDLPIFDQTSRWLDIYFSGHAPDFTPKYRLGRCTPFQKSVYAIMKNIPFGSTMTYGEIADHLVQNQQKDQRNLINLSQNKSKPTKMSPQAIGGAVGANPICLILPCHRVIGSNGNMVGYSGGIDNKIALLRHEGIIWQ